MSTSLIISLGKHGWRSSAAQETTEEEQCFPKLLLRVAIARLRLTGFRVSRHGFPLSNQFGRKSGGQSNPGEPLTPSRCLLVIQCDTGPIEQLLICEAIMFYVSLGGQEELLQYYTVPFSSIKLIQINLW